MNECAHAWITVMLPMIFVGLDIVGALADSNVLPLLIDDGDITVHRNLHPLNTIHFLEQCWVSTTGLSHLKVLCLETLSQVTLPLLT